MAELWDANREIERLQLKLAEAERERGELKHDIARHVQIASDIATDAEARIAKLIEALNKVTTECGMYGRDELSFRVENIARAALQSGEPTG